MGLPGDRNACVKITACAALAAAASIGHAATIRFDNEGGDNLWETPANWVGDVLPAAIDIAELNASSAPTVNGDLVVNLSSAQTVTELQVSNPGNSSAYVPGTTTLNVLPGADLSVTSSIGVRVGRTPAVGQANNSSTGRIVQTGGIFQITAGANGLRLSQADTNSGNSYYSISDGIVRGANGSAAAVADLRVGATGVNYERAEFHVIGSGADEIRFLDVQVADSTTGSGGRSVFHFSLDGGGVTPITADDEFQFRTATAGASSGLLQVDLIAEAPQSDVTLVSADRLGSNGGALEQFSNYADGATLVASGAGWEYTYTVDYTDALDDSTRDASIVLHYVSRTAIPEPSAAALLGAAGLGLLARRGRRTI